MANVLPLWLRSCIHNSWTDSYWPKLMDIWFGMGLQFCKNILREVVKDMPKSRAQAY